MTKNKRYKTTEFNRKLFRKQGLRLVSMGNSQHQGKREYQEDSFCTLIAPAQTTRAHKLRQFYGIVADGMGGLSNSSYLSDYIVSYLSRKIGHEFSNATTLTQLYPMILELNKTIKEEGLQGGSTLAILHYLDGTISWCSLGDSRIYLMRNLHLYQLTQDHNYKNDLLEDVINNKADLADAISDPLGTFLTSYMGSSQLTPMDYNPTPFHLKPKDVVLLCTDGVYQTLTQAELVSCLTLPAQEAANTIERKILDKGYDHQDNFTSLIYKFR